MTRNAKEIALPCGLKTVVDPEMAEILRPLKWHSIRGKTVNYAATSTKNVDGEYEHSRLHHYVVGFPLNGLVVDHINGDGLDNRRANLRIVSNSVNVLNRHHGKKKTSRYPGVQWTEKLGKWRVEIKNPADRKTTHLGYFHKEEDAHGAYLEYMVSGVIKKFTFIQEVICPACRVGRVLTRRTRTIGREIPTKCRECGHLFKSLSLPPPDGGGA